MFKTQYQSFCWKPSCRARHLAGAIKYNQFERANLLASRFLKFLLILPTFFFKHGSVRLQVMSLTLTAELRLCEGLTGMVPADGNRIRAFLQRDKSYPQNATETIHRIDRSHSEKNEAALSGASEQMPHFLQLLPEIRYQFLA